MRITTSSGSPAPSELWPRAQQALNSETPGSAVRHPAHYRRSSPDSLCTCGNALDGMAAVANEDAGQGRRTLALNDGDVGLDERMMAVRGEGLWQKQGQRTLLYDVWTFQAYIDL